MTRVTGAEGSAWRTARTAAPAMALGSMLVRMARLPEAMES